MYPCAECSAVNVYLFHLLPQNEIADQQMGIENGFKEVDVSALTATHDEPREAVQVFEDPAPENSGDAVGCPIMHTSGLNHAAGQAVYVDDMPPFRSEYA